LATFVKLKSGSWRAVVRHKNKYVSRTFLRKDDARGWARDQERNIDQGRTPVTARAQRAQTFGDLIDLHIADMKADMKEVGKPPGRSKDATLTMLKRVLGNLKAGEIDRDQLIKFGRRRAVHVHRNLLAVPMKLLGPCRLVADVDHHRDAFVQAQQRPWKLAVVGRGLDHDARRQFDLRIDDVDRVVGGCLGRRRGLLPGTSRKHSRAAELKNAPAIKDHGSLIQ
jgi:hypothetical protein